MPKLEIIADFERLQKRVDALQQRFPSLEILTRSAFFVILGCSIPSMLSEQEKIWLQAMIDAQVIHRYRCKEREDR